MKKRMRLPGTRPFGRGGASGILAILSLAVLAWSAVPAVARGAIQPSLTPSRTTGVAPLYVFFDAWDTTADGVARPAHELLFRWNFADPASGSWTTDGQSRNTASGPLAAHVFETPGTYVVSLAVSDGAGGTASQTATIVVDDPETVFSGTNTVCFSQTTDFTGAPAGSQQITTTDFSSIHSHAATGKRLLLHRGQTWDVSDTLSLDKTGPCALGAFGTGAAPILHQAASFYPFLMPGGADWRVMDLEIDGASYSGDTRGINGSAAQLLCLRLNIHDIHSCIMAAGDQVAICDSTLRHLVNGGGGYIAYITASRLGVLGSTMWDSTEAEHVMRAPQIDRGVIGHNVMGMQSPSKHVLKIHAPNSSTGQYSERVIIADNRFTGNSDWTVSLEPQNSASDERLRDFIIERNLFLGNSAVQVGLIISGQEFTVRNNIANCTNWYGRNGVDIERRGIEPAPLNCRVYNNTVYAANGTVTLLATDSTATSITARNNLATSPVGTSVAVSNGGINLVSDHNLATQTPGFISANPTSATDFALAPGSPAIDAGTPVPVLDDFTGANRPAGSGYDLGAYEYGSDDHAPEFTADPFTKAAATVGKAYSGSIASNASDPDTSDTLTFSKQSGPSWLSVAADGTLGGTPLAADVGLSTSTVRVTDRFGLSDDATMRITVVAPEPRDSHWVLR